ncbi:hypothetical protein WJX81_001937 [Elliptochloris bilobata]|uniref:Uncharacterized protein n=1 Tax=Elliptochloris bilobata TaxID=381761 RepID=A0AAW1RM21_9CHLO
MLFMVVNSVWDELAAMLAIALGLSLQTTSLVVLVLGLMLYCPLSEVLFGAGTSFNPLNNAAFAAAGTTVVLRWVPQAWQGRFRTFDQTLKVGVSLGLGAACEGVLSFAINLVVLWSLSTRHKRLGFVAPLAATVVLILAGWPTGPAMNSAWIFGWWAQFGSHTATQHVVIYWAAPLTGAVAAGALWSALNAPRRRGRPRGAKSPQKAPAPAAREDGQRAAKRPPAAAALCKKAD